MMQKILSFLKKHKNYVWMLAVFLFLAYGANFAIVLGSDAYQVAKTYVRGSKEVSDEIGKVEDVNIAFSLFVKGGVRSGGSKGTAYYYLNVLTNLGIREVYVELKKVDDKWKVESHRILES